MIKSGKKTTLSLLVCGLVAAGPALAQPELYGKLSLSLENYRAAAGDSLWQISNQASRLGVKGKVDLDNNLKAVYQYEVGMDPSQSGNPVFSQRNAFLGLEGGFGQLITGTFDTPLKQAQGKVDLFNDTTLDMGGYLSGEVRHAQSVQYATPKMGGFVAMVDWMPAKTAADDDGVSASIGFKQERFEATLAADQKVDGDAGVVTIKGNPQDAVRLALSFALADSVKLGLLAQQSEGVDADESRETGWMASMAWTLDRVTLKGQVGQGLADKDAAGNSSDAKQEQVALGADYKLAKNVKAFGYAGVNRNSDGAAGTAVDESRNDYHVGVGMTLDF